MIQRKSQELLLSIRAKEAMASERRQTVGCHVKELTGKGKKIPNDWPNLIPICISPHETALPMLATITGMPYHGPLPIPRDHFHPAESMQPMHRMTSDII
ncbi:hypothetical protein CEXT_393311 [Caerostris extrusa]|uniref:Uncharacterized protein n=1 Tax=Caerostris extrusa TaxID=172846 RepID=A0AAV4NVJ9_CAEEX|nr:hypothetical protein CEXT_393311 [Caerostris extrusa]